MTQISNKRLERLGDKEYRQAFMEEMVANWIGYQIRELREQNKWSQSELAQKSAKSQSTIARLEDENYGAYSVRSLFELAEAFDVALLVKFVDWPTFLASMEDLSPTAMRVNAWAADQFAQSMTKNPASTLTIRFRKVTSPQNQFGASEMSFSDDTMLRMLPSLFEMFKSGATKTASATPKVATAIDLFDCVGRHGTGAAA